ncbi:transcription factor that binds to CRE motif [Ciborinia camelliae]|nr:transcription factor that binds to CRE motif [Ciborinia camelliae]
MSTPNLKFEQSPAESLAESFTSTPGHQYPSLFHPQESMEPLQAMTPQSFDEDSMFGDDVGGSMAGTPAPEKKPVKKRKSWGQQLPEPKTNLPPRKRAKTEDEKEQRRVERVLRNRRAAQSSRERKRQEVEALEEQKKQIERRNHDLELQLADMSSKYQSVLKRLEDVTGIPGGNLPPAFLPSSAASTPRRQETFDGQSPIALTKDLFAAEQDSSIRPMMTPQANRDTHNAMQSAMDTINPSSLSPPSMEPADESSFDASSFGMTQHPAAMLCDLPCQPKEQELTMSGIQESLITRLLTTSLWIHITLAAFSTILIPLEQIKLSLTTGSALSATPSLMTLIIWLATTSAPLTSSSLMTSSFTKTRSHSLRPKFTLRIRFLRRLLSCSPNMARPLLDATLEAMRLWSKQQLPRDCLNGAGVCDFGNGGKSSSLESLITLFWSIKVIMKEQAEAQTQTISEPDAVMYVGQSCGQLEDLFRGRKGWQFPGNLASTVDGGTLSEKSLDGPWRMALEDEPSS